MPLYANVPSERQQELARVFWWLSALISDSNPPPLKKCSVSVFDHWLTEKEAVAQLERVPVEVQKSRDAKHKAFCAALVQTTEVLPFRAYGRDGNGEKVKFRNYENSSKLARYLQERSGSIFRFHVVLPEWQLAFVSGFDDTSHFFGLSADRFPDVAELALKNGLHVLEHGS